MTVFRTPVFPTCVGVFPPRIMTVTVTLCLPHVRGGVSGEDKFLRMIQMSSPRAWGCFCSIRKDLLSIGVFPTCVGVFLLDWAEAFQRPRLPHVRGGVSTYIKQNKKRRSLPHVRGGVSFGYHRQAAWYTSSPRAWGCFPCRALSWIPARVFPTCVGVFPAKTRPPRGGACLPHVRGGVSLFRMKIFAKSGSSPRAWGCSAAVMATVPYQEVFPTCVGVFPTKGQKR